MIRRSTVVYLVLLLVLAGAYYYLNKREKPADIGSTAEPSPQVAPAYLFSAAQGTPTSIRVESKSGKTVEVVRGADNAWALTQPIETKAEQGAAEAAASQITTMRILDSVPDLDPKIVGLDIPEYVLTIKFTSGVEQKADIGVVTPTESGYYVRDMAGKIVIISKDAIDSLVTLLDNPPYLETLTPNPSPSTETLTQVPSTPEAGTAASETATP
ncbi:MAG TPA: hypothetical protein VK206_27030 [Anaerolineales bacterium]|nr:hypothetical protein [Anaerolineales bacterium]